MFEALLWTAIAIALIALISTLDGSRDVFHPLVLITPMMIFLYGWMPMRLLKADGLSRFFDDPELIFIQSLNILGILAFVCACLAVGTKVGRFRPKTEHLPAATCRRLRIGSAIVGGIGLLCWTVSIVNVGGFVNAFSKAVGGGWDDSGYIRDGSLLILVGILLTVSAAASDRKVRTVDFLLFGLFGMPWISQAMLTGRRGPTFGFVVVVSMGWFMYRNRRPPVVLVGTAGLLLGWLVLFLVANRSSLYIGSDFDLKSDVSDMVEKPDTGNEYIYGTGTVISSKRRDHYFWMRRYLAQLLVRPIPTAIWPTKYEDFGVPELLNNAGTGEGFSDTLGWTGAIGAAPGIIADLWVELSWGAVLAMALLGWLYGWAWRKAVLSGPGWKSQYVILAALSIYMVMQTMEAIIFRSILLSTPCWIVWRWALRASESERSIRVPAEHGLIVTGGALNA